MTAIPATDAPSHDKVGRHGSVGVWGAAALVAGSMVGAGIYLLPASLAATGSIAILGWVAATVAALAIAGVFVWLGPLAPQSDGLPDYVHAGLGRFFGVQAALLYLLSGWVGLLPLALGVAGVAGFLVPALAGPVPKLVVTLTTIWAAVGVAWAGPKIVTRAAGVTLVLGLAPVLLVAVAGWFFFRPEVFMASWNPGAASTFAAVRGSGLSCFFAFLGLECAAATAGIVRDPVRNVPRATLLGVLGVAAFYMAASTVVMGVLPAAALAKSSAPFGDVAQAAMGAGLGAAIAICSAVRGAGSLIGWMLVTSETARSAADTGDFLPAFRTRPGERVSAWGLLTAGGVLTLTALLTVSPNLAEQFSMVANVTTLLCLYTYGMAAVSLLRLCGGLSGGRRAGAVATAILALAASAVLVLAAKPWELAGSLAGVAAAALLYLWLRRRR
jgi:arginine:agmatine antiporter